MSEFSEVLAINKHRLDDEWERQPILFQEYLGKLSDAREEEMKCKERVKVGEAEISKAIRLKPEDFNMTKVTEGSITSAVATHPGVLNLKEKWIDSKHSLDVLESAVRALEHKKTALEQLVKLQLAGYFSEPKIKVEGETKVIQEQIKEKIASNDVKVASKPRKRRVKKNV
jgi:hypothetical protein